MMDIKIDDRTLQIETVIPEKLEVRTYDIYNLIEEKNRLNNQISFMLGRISDIDSLIKRAGDAGLSIPNSNSAIQPLDLV